jgi:RNA polymerase sigma factor (sigma-70 family)
MHITLRQLRMVQRAVIAFKRSVSAESPEDLGITIEDPKPSQPDEQAQVDDQKALVRRLMPCLDDRQQKILALRFGLSTGQPATLTEIGTLLDLTRERVRQIESEALRRLNDLMTANRAPPTEALQQRAPGRCIAA